MIHRLSYSNILYRCRDEAGVLLYIGICRDIPRRMENHRASSKAWIGRVATIESVVLPDYHAARLAGMEAIRAERPLFNIRHQRRVAS